MNHGLVGARVRARRMDRGVAQAALAREAGISPSYLNLIEHGRRRIGGKLLWILARALDCEVELLSEGAEAGLLDGLRRVAAGAGADVAGLDRAEELAEGFAGWARLLMAQDARIAARDRTIAGLDDRLTHDPALAAAVHDILSVATAIRSTSTILVDDAEIAPEWRARFHRNLHEDSGRLAVAARGLAEFLSAGRAAAGDASTPLEEMEAWLAARGFHVAELEDAPLPPDPWPADMEVGPGRDLLRRALARYAEDARALPMDRIGPALDRTGPDPFALATDLGVELSLVMRRLASLPPARVGGPVGLVFCDASGAVTFRRAVDGFDLPRYGPGCPLWPLHQVALAPQVPLAATLRQTGPSARPFRAWAMARTGQPRGFDGPLVAETTMLLVPADLLPGPGGAPERAVGVTCRLCPLPDCPARREPSILPPDVAEGAESHAGF